MRSSEDTGCDKGLTPEVFGMFRSLENKMAPDVLLCAADVFNDYGEFYGEKQAVQLMKRTVEVCCFANFSMLDLENVFGHAEDDTSFIKVVPI